MRDLIELTKGLIYESSDTERLRKLAQLNDPQAQAALDRQNFRSSENAYSIEQYVNKVFGQKSVSDFFDDTAAGERWISWHLLLPHDIRIVQTIIIDREGVSAEGEVEVLRDGEWVSDQKMTEEFNFNGWGGLLYYHSASKPSKPKSPYEIIDLFYNRTRDFYHQWILA